MRRSLLLLAGIALIACESNQTHVDEHSGYEAGTVTPLLCTPNLDGQIDSTELTAVLGTLGEVPRVTFGHLARRRTWPAPWSPQGHLGWGLSGRTTPTTRSRPSRPRRSRGSGTRPRVPEGTGSSALRRPSTRATRSRRSTSCKTPTASTSKALAPSTQPSPPDGQTLLVYQQPVTLYPFPLKVGATWTTTGVVRNGMLKGNPWAESDTYQGKDVATGQLVLPDFTFTQAHRVEFVVTLTPAARRRPDHHAAGLVSLRVLRGDRARDQRSR